MRLIGGLLALRRPFTRVLHRQTADNHQHLGQAAIPLSRQHHAPQARIDRQTGKLRAEFAQTTRVIHRLQFKQQVIRRLDLSPIRLVQKREIIHMPKLQTLHAQNHRRQIGAQNFRVGVRRTLGKIIFRVQADANARAESPATPRTLARRRLTDRLDLQTLDARVRRKA